MTRSIHNPEDLARLPLWAHSEIASLLRDNAELRARLGEGPDGSDTFLEGWHTHPNRPLGDRPTINFGLRKFTTATGEHEQPVFQARLESTDEPTLYVSTYQGSIAILPGSTNSFRVQVAKR